jgi:hypothetical protein
VEEKRERAVSKPFNENRLVTFCSQMAICANARDLHPTRAQIQKEQDEEPLQRSFGPYFHTEEIGRHDKAPVLREKLLPGGLALALGCGLDALSRTRLWSALAFLA